MTENHRKSIAERAIGLVDLTDLNDHCDEAAVSALCQRAQTPYGFVGAICIWPQFVAHARTCLTDTGIPIATVVNFPSGNDSIEVTVKLTRQAILDGADEIDLVMPYSAFLDGDVVSARHMIEATRRACGDKVLLKVILETGELKDFDQIGAASDLAISAGADFIKTSTGKVEVNATLDAAQIMLNAIRRCKKPVGFKPAGGIKITEDCGAYLALADDIMGSDWVSSKTFRFGASSVLDDLLAAMEGKTSGSGKDY
ncbi:MAG: deoxyribose-phosphate aldolase [Rhizobiaceae bacterium]